MTEIKPCPFCGGEATISKYSSSYYVECDKCEARTKFYGNFLMDGKKEAIKAWNRRVNNG